MKTLAQETGALSYFPQTVQELKGIYAGISDELSNQYSIGYSPIELAPRRPLPPHHRQGQRASGVPSARTPGLYGGDASYRAVTPDSGAMIDRRV